MADEHKKDEVAAGAPAPQAGGVKEEDGPKVFVGNLAFATTEARLLEFFKPAGGVTIANIITRGPRSLGYGFVSFESEAAAQNAVTLFDKKELDGREINVEVAKPRSAEDSAAQIGAPRGGPRSRGNFRGRGGNPRFAKNGSPAAAATAPAAVPQENGAAPAAADGTNVRARRARGSRGGRGRASGPRFSTQDGAAAAPAAAAAAPAKAAEPKAPREPSKTSLFVANLPFSVDDAGLSAIFNGFNPKTAHVVRKRNGRSKGFGFVEVGDEAEQKRAIEALNQKDVEGRPIIVKVANGEAAAEAAASSADN